MRIRPPHLSAHSQRLAVIVLSTLLSGVLLAFSQIGTVSGSGVATADAGMATAGAITASTADPVSREAVTLNTDHGFFVINAEVARTPAQRDRGLMNRDELAEDRGMLFLWDAPTPVTMWMRNTRISLDMIFIKPSGIIHRIVSNTVPYSEDLISSRGDVLAVLEVQGGLAGRIGLRPGHRIHHPAFNHQQ